MRGRVNCDLCPGAITDVTEELLWGLIYLTFE
jgi:hypothetical protein